MLYRLLFDHLCAVKKSRKILKLPDDFDGEGSVAYTEEVWTRAVELYLNCVVELYVRHSYPLPVFSVNNGPDGSIDLHYDGGPIRLLINVPADHKTPVTYYGESPSVKIKGDGMPTTEEILCLLTE